MSSKLIVDTIEDSTGTYSLALGSGNSTFPGGIHIGGTGSANLLDDYEVGTWTPTVIGSSGNPTVTYGNQSGSYVKVGSFVQVDVYLTTSAISGGSGNLQVAGLPFTAKSSTGGYPEWYTGSIGYITNFSSSNAPRAVMVTQGDTALEFWTSNSSDGRDDIDTRVNVGSWGSSANLYCTLTYLTDS
jgi:hypothetical protein